MFSVLGRLIDIILVRSSRFVIFPRVDDEMSAWDALSKSDKRAFRSIAAVLHLDDEQAKCGVLSDCMFDMSHVSTKESAGKR
jgi:hypothetical protein